MKHMEDILGQFLYPDILKSFRKQYIPSVLFVETIVAVCNTFSRRIIHKVGEFGVERVEERNGRGRGRRRCRRLMISTRRGSSISTATTVTAITAIATTTTTAIDVISI